MILRNVVKIVATRRHILKLKCTKLDFGRISLHNGTGVVSDWGLSPLATLDHGRYSAIITKVSNALENGLMVTSK